MSGEHEVDRRPVYQIRVRGELGKRWSDWFDDLSVAVEGEHSPVTTLTGRVDQAALRGVLNVIWDLGLTLISVTPQDAAVDEE